MVNNATAPTKHTNITLEVQCAKPAEAYTKVYLRRYDSIDEHGNIVRTYNVPARRFRNNGASDILTEEEMTAAILAGTASVLSI